MSFSDFPLSTQIDNFSTVWRKSGYWDWGLPVGEGPSEESSGGPRFLGNVVFAPWSFREQTSFPSVPSGKPSAKGVRETGPSVKTLQFTGNASPRNSLTSLKAGLPKSHIPACAASPTRIGSFFDARYAWTRFFEDGETTCMHSR